MKSNSYKNIVSAETYVIRTGAGVLERITINKAVASGTITIYDNTAASGTKIGTVTLPGTLLQNQFVLDYGVVFTTGLTIVMVEANDITVAWRPE